MRGNRKFLQWVSMQCCCICLFGFFPSHSRIFSLFWRRHLAGEGLQILAYARYWWLLSSEGSLTCHTYCDTGQPFIMVISEVIHTWCRAFGGGAVTTCFNDVGLLNRGSNPDLLPARRTLYHHVTAAVSFAASSDRNSRGYWKPI